MSETAGAQVGFAKCLITRPGVVPTSHMGVLGSFPSPGVLSRTSPLIAASPFCPGPFSPDQGGIPPEEPHVTPSPCCQGDATHRFNKRGPGPSPSLKGTFAEVGEAKGRERDRRRGIQLTASPAPGVSPPRPLLPSGLLLPDGWIKCFLFPAPLPLPHCVLRCGRPAVHSWLRTCYDLQLMHHPWGLLKSDKTVASHCRRAAPFPEGGGELGVLLASRKSTAQHSSA